MGYEAIALDYLLDILFFDITKQTLNSCILGPIYNCLQMLRRVVQLPTPCYLPGLNKRADRIYVDGRISGFTPNGT